MKLLTKQRKIVIKADLARGHCDGLTPIARNWCAAPWVSGGMIIQSRARPVEFASPAQPSRGERRGFMGKLSPRGARMPRCAKEIDAAPTGNPRGDCR